MGDAREPYEGFLGGLEYLWTGGNENGIHYDRAGNPTGPAPVTGIAPSPAKIGKISGLLVKSNGVWKWAVNGQVASQQTLKSVGLIKANTVPVVGKPIITKTFVKTTSRVPNATTPLSTWGKIKQTIRIFGQWDF